MKSRLMRADQGNFKKSRRGKMAEKLLTQRKALFNQSINQSIIHNVLVTTADLGQAR